jgi:hypothetical protein
MRMPQLLSSNPITRFHQIKHAIAPTPQAPRAPPAAIFRFHISVELAAHQTGMGPLKLTVVVGESSTKSFTFGDSAPELNKYNQPNTPDSNSSGSGSGMMVQKDTVSVQEKSPREPSLKRKRNEIADEHLRY